MSIKIIETFLFLECWKLDNFFKILSLFLLLTIPIKFFYLPANLKLINTSTH